ncbi:MAG: Unknown protein [uncultured Aureispira sp.]|uniref:Carrier domain-containing protein n=1 Tax=uncultured Aureispira sp. TaxID=1331704 RepID=A0A6S6ULI5_9BACT|nr:MAG: Unknown protein [uncultured Aureispira sp.]
MNYDEISETVQSILIQHFNIPVSAFSWEESLEKQQADFKILDYLIFLERLLQSKFKKDFFLLENISTAIHNPKDIVVLIMESFKNELEEK